MAVTIWYIVVLPVPGLSLLGGEGVVALGVFRLAKQQLSVLGHVVDPHGAVGCDAHNAPTVGRCPVGRVLVQRHEVQGQEESGGGRTDAKSVTKHMQQRENRVKL